MGGTWCAYHVTSSENRDSIRKHGLDWRRRVNSIFGIAGSRAAEGPCVLLARDLSEVDFFVQMGKHRHSPLDVWKGRTRR